MGRDDDASRKDDSGAVRKPSTIQRNEVMPTKGLKNILTANPIDTKAEFIDMRVIGAWKRKNGATECLCSSVPVWRKD